MSTDFQYIVAEKFKDHYLLTINRESKLNALNSGVIDELSRFFEKTDFSEVVGVIFTGSGEKAFIAGADISQMQDMTIEEAEAFARNGQRLTLLMEKCPRPVIAAVNGFALGGGLEMALACDFIYASENAKFGLPEVSLGLIPGFGGTQRLSKVIGRSRAKELSYTGEMINAAKAQDYGLVLEVLKNKEELLSKARETLDKIAKNSPYAVGIVKSVVNDGVDKENELGLNIEAAEFGKIFGSHDMKEGTKAFLEKRKASFKGK